VVSTLHNRRCASLIPSHTIPGIYWYHVMASSVHVPLHTTYLLLAYSVYWYHVLHMHPLQCIGASTCATGVRPLHRFHHQLTGSVLPKLLVPQVPPHPLDTCVPLIAGRMHMHALVLPPVHDVQSCPSGITYCAWYFHTSILTYFPQCVWHQVLLMVLTALHVIMAHGI
jgi:hypothetical protein